jgi:hypothetical protein
MNERVTVIEPVVSAIMFAGLAATAMHLFAAAVTAVFSVAGWQLPWS